MTVGLIQRDSWSRYQITDFNSEIDFWTSLWNEGHKQKREYLCFECSQEDITDDPEDIPDPVKPTTLQKLLRAYTPEDKQVEGESVDYLKLQVDNTIRVVWKEAMKRSEGRDTKRAEEQDVHAAFNEIFYPYTLLEETTTKMGEYQLELRRTVNRSSILDLEDGEDE